jgi:NB-ARC domain/Calcineurin-like phosphoesterase
MPGPYCLRILHLSDLHERVGLDWMNEARRTKVRLTEVDRRLVLDDSNLLDVLQHEIGQVDLLCFTGDAADWGLPGEFSKAGERLGSIMKATGVSAERLFVVPGNHDIHRAQAADAWTGFRGLGYSSALNREISDWMAGLNPPRGVEAAWRDAIATRTAAFWDWVRDGLGRNVLLPCNSRHGRLGYRITVPGLDFPFDVHVLGFDSAWLCGDDNDTGKLRLTSGQVKLLARDGDGRPLRGFRLALVHHPLTDLADHRECFRLLAPCADLLLHGHQHDPIAEAMTDPDRQLVVLATGSLYADEAERWINSFHVIEARLNESGRPLEYVVTFWGWSDRGHWHRTGAVYEQAQGGVLKLSLGDGRVASRAAGGREYAAATNIPRELEPPYFVPRLAELERVKGLLLDADKVRPVAIVGMPGVGKSTLAAALVRDHDIAQRFEQRILWATLGADDPRIATHLGQFLSALGSPGQSENAIEPAQEQLAEILGTTPALIVLDDVWSATAAKPFLDALGPRCALVMTTRDSGIAELSDARRVDLPPMSPQESMVLVERLLNRPIADADRNAATAVAAEVGYLPLSLWLICARIREGDSWEGLRAKLADEETRLRALEPPVAPDEAVPKNRSLVAAFNLSIDSLGARDREQFGLLSLLAEDTSFTPNVAANVWSVDRADAELALRLLHRKGLILLGAAVSDEARGFRMHDEQRNAARRVLGLGRTEAHQRLLEIYQRRAPNGWADAIDDGYLLDHLVEHLVHAGHTDELRALLAQDRNGRNAWFLAREQQLNGWLADLEVAASAPGSGPEEEARYVMMASSVGSLASNLPFGVARELVERGMWSPARALAWALSSPPANRLSSLVALADILDEPFHSRAIDAALAVIREAPEEEPHGKVWYFSRLPLGLPESARTSALELAKGARVNRTAAVIAVLRGFAKARRFDIVHGEVEALGDFDRSLLQFLVPHLPVEQMPWIEAHLDKQDDVRAEIAVRWVTLGEPLRALERLREMSEYYQTNVIERTAGQWDPGPLCEVELVANAMKEVRYRTRAQLTVWAQLDEPERTARYRAFWNDFKRGAGKALDDALRSALPNMPRAAIEMLVLDKSLPFLLLENDARIALASRAGQLGDVDGMWELLRGEVDRTLAKKVAPFLTEKHLTAIGVTSEECDPILLSYLLPRWAELGYGREAVATLTRTRTFMDFHAQSASAMAPYLGSEELDLLRAECERIADRPAQLKFLLSLAAHAPNELSEYLFDPYIETAAQPEVMHEIAKVAPRELARRLHEHLHDPLLRLAVASTHDVVDPEQLIDDLAAAQSHLQNRIVGSKDLPLSEASAVWRATSNALWLFAKGLDVVPRSHRARAIKIGRDAANGNAYGVLGAPEVFARLWSTEEVADNVLERRDWEAYNIGGLANVAALTGDPEQRMQIEELIVGLLKEASTAETALKDVSSADTLTPFLASRALEIADGIARDIGYLSWGAPELVELLARMGWVEDAIRIAALTDKYDTHYIKSLVALARHLPAPRHREYLEDAWRRVTTTLYHHRNWTDAEALGVLAMRAARESKPFVEKLWSRATHFLTTQPRPELWDYLASLAPVLVTLTGPAGVRKTWDAARDVTRWWP